MVYVAFGLFIASLSFLCYAYKQPRWDTKWPRSRSTNCQITPEISIGIPNIHHPGDPSREGKTEKKDSKTTESAESGRFWGLDQSRSEGKEHQATFQQPQETVKAQTGREKSEASLDAGNAAANQAIGMPQPRSASNKADEASEAATQPPARPGPRLRPKANNLMAPPPSPQWKTANLQVPPSTSTTLRPPPSAAATLRTPPARSQATLSPFAVPTASTLPSSKRPSKKVILEPGHSPLDWANLINHPPPQPISAALTCLPI